MNLNSPVNREPKQARSRESLERTADAALSLVRQTGSGDFTLAEVSARSRVSIGSIYARFGSKEELLRFIHDRAMEDLEAAAAHSYSSITAQDQEALPEVVRAVVGCAVTVLRQQSSTLRPFMLIGTHDAVIAQRGRLAAVRHSDEFGAALSLWTGGKFAAEALVWCFDVVFSVVARRLGLGSTEEGSGTASFDIISANLSDMIAPYLQANADLSSAAFPHSQ